MFRVFARCENGEEMGDKGKHDLIMIQEKLKAFSFGGGCLRDLL